jgi:hypothetical protein
VRRNHTSSALLSRRAAAMVDWSCCRRHCSVAGRRFPVLHAG